MTDIADTAAEWFDAVSAVIHQWYELSGSEGPNRERHSDNRRAHSRASCLRADARDNGGRREQARSVKKQCNVSEQKTRRWRGGSPER